MRLPKDYLKQEDEYELGIGAATESPQTSHVPEHVFDPIAELNVQQIELNEIMKNTGHKTQHLIRDLSKLNT